MYTKSCPDWLFASYSCSLAMDYESCRVRRDIHPSTLYPSTLYGVMPGIVILTTLRMQLQPVFHISSLNALDPGSGREIPAICHDPALGMVISPQNPSTENGHVPCCSCILSVV